MSAYEPNWESLERHRIPRWFRDEPFGVYFHWGPYAVPAYGTEWYPHYMYKPDSDRHDMYEHHVENYGDPAEVGYHEFVSEFTGEAFDADAWARLCEEAGADYVGLTAVHHDGFALWDSDLTEWNAADKGPQRDVLGELAAAVRDRGMKFVAAFHHAMKWWYYPRDEAYHTTDPEYAGLYGQPHEPGEDPPEEYFQRWYDMTVEVIDAYRPDALWFDAGWGVDAFLERDEYRRELIAYYYNRAEEWGKEVGVCHKEELPPGVGIVDHERSRRDDVSQRRWLTDTSIDRASWGYVEDHDFKSVETMVRGFVDRVSKNGNTLLNVGPRADGTIPGEAAERLRAFGDWLATNREAVAGARPGWTFGEGAVDGDAGESASTTSRGSSDPPVRFTRNGEDAFVIMLDWPDDGTVEVTTPLGRLLSTWAFKQPERMEVSLVGAPDVDPKWEVEYDEEADWSPVEHDDDREAVLRVSLPAEPPEALDSAYALRVEVE